jgi:hypothetical protein
VKSILLALVVAMDCASAQVNIVSNTSEPATSNPGFYGESFTTPAGGPWNHITFNFYATPSVGSTPASNPSAVGTAFLLTQQYLGTPAALSSSTPGFLAQSTSNAGGVYTFPPTVTLNPNTEYWVYENASMTVTGFPFAGGPSESQYSSTSSTTDYVMGALDNFLVAGDPVGVAATPIPSSILLTALGVGILGLIEARRRFRARLGA